ncbi:hypothetical protein AMJ80_00570 [bacterium SM23_31]|nr:MAG: hypothetical protein AMJ80_00570 [bacterium SM23_31]
MKLLLNKYLFAFLSILFFEMSAFILPAGVYAQFETYNHPELKWETIETEHFNVHFHSGEYRTPRIIAKIAEEVYEPVTQAYNFEPDSKIDIIVRDHDDYSNGAAYYYDNKVEIWALSLDFLLRGTSNWLRNVVTHEFTHMIQMQTARKMPRRFPAVYIQNIEYEDEKRPDVLYGFPNRIISYPFSGTVIPGWFAEGVAQYHTMKQGYDAWDSHRDMILRVRALNGEIYSLTEMGVFGKSSIGNESVYNQGYSFVGFLAQQYGSEILEEISRAMSSPASLTIEHAMENSTGQSAKNVYAKWKDELEKQYLINSDNIRKNLMQGEILRTNGTANIFPKWSPDGESVAYLSNNKSDYLSNTGLYIEVPGMSERKQLKKGVVSPPVWDPTGEMIVYAKLTKNNYGSNYHDLYVYDIVTDKERKITKSMRARYPSFSPDGKTIYFVSSTDGICTLNTLDIASGTVSVLKEFNDGEDIFASTVSTDGSRIVFSVSSHFGRDIAIINADGSQFRYLLKGKEDERSPVFSHDGAKIYFSSDKTGIYNIYEYNLTTGEIKPVTNVLGGAFMPSVNDKGQLIYSLYTKDGYKLVLLGEMQYVDPVYMTYEPGISDGIPGVRYDDGEIPDFPSKPYTFHFQKTSFFPRIMVDYGIPKLGFYSFTGDVLDKYSLFMGAAVNKDLDRDLFALFEFKELRETLFLELYNLTRHIKIYTSPSETQLGRTDEVVLGYWEVDLGARRRISKSQEIQVKALYGRQSANVKPIIPDYSGVIKPLGYDYFKAFDFNVEWRYTGILPRMDQEINPSYGREIIFNYWRNRDKIFEDFVIAQAGFLQEVYKKYAYHKITLDWREYVGLPFILDRSALTVRFQGGYISKPVDDFLYFFAGGLTGLKGYSFYSLEGRKMAVGSVTYRFPVLKDIGIQLGPWYFDKLYASVGYQIGDAWSEKSPDIKKGVDIGLRLDMFSFYSYPTKIGFNIAYGFDRFAVANRKEGKNWKFFLTVLFGYDF